MATDQPLPRGVRPGFVAWFTGPPASGKTSVARELRRRLSEGGIHSVILDSDDLRRALTPTPSYTDEERDWVYGVIVHLAAWLADSGVNVLIAATAHKREYRRQARERIPRFAEVYVRCPLEVCEQRDRKGIYAQARRGTADRVPGVGVSYEPPPSPEAKVNTEHLSAAEAAAAVEAQLGELLK